MSNEVRRVPLDFDWPLNKVWGGYVRPAELDGERCEECNGSGQTHFGWWLQAFSYVMGMLAGDVREQERGNPMHPWLRNFPHPHGHWEYPVADDPQSGPGNFVIDRPSADALDFFAALMGVDKDQITGSLFGRQPNYAVMTKLLEVTGADELAGWMSDPARGDRWVPAETARKFIEAGWAPTGVGQPGRGVVPGIEAVGWDD